MQINLVIGSLIASFFDGAVAWLTYADRLYQLPLGVVGIAVGIVLMPELSRRIRNNDLPGARHSLNRSAEFALALTLPATVALIAIPSLVAAALFQRGAFTAFDAAQTGAATALFALGLPAFVLIKTLTPGFFADEDSRTPLRLSLWTMGANTAMSLAGVWLVGWLAIPSGDLHCRMDERRVALARVAQARLCGRRPPACAPAPPDCGKCPHGHDRSGGCRTSGGGHRAGPAASAHSSCSWSAGWSPTRLPGACSGHSPSRRSRGGLRRK